MTPYTVTTLTQDGSLVIDTAPTPPCNNLPPHVRTVFCKHTTSPAELAIARRIRDNPHHSIVTVYDVAGTCVYMEHLDTDAARELDPTVLLTSIYGSTAAHLRALGVVYVDWKPDNIGISQDTGLPKLFDFNMSGVVDPKDPTKWELEPDRGFALRMLEEQGFLEAEGSLFGLEQHAMAIGTGNY